jgi:hypothetical protein
VDDYDSFITFTNDYSRYSYIYPIKEWLEDLDKFKTFKVEIENQHDLNIKIVRSDHVCVGCTTVVITLMTKLPDLLQGFSKRMT